MKPTGPDAAVTVEAVGGEGVSGMDEAAFLALARRRYDDAINADRENREAGYDDVKFVASEQWPDAIKRARELEGRPCLTVNELPQYVRQVTGDMRLNRPSIKVAPAEDGDVAAAEVIEGLIRSIEDQSDATRVYVERLEDACRSNMGFMRVTTDYASDEAFDLDLRIRGIQNPFSVIGDPASEDPTWRDARFVFVYDDMPIEEFRAQYPDAATSGFETSTAGTADSEAGRSTMQGWRTADTVRVAEYWVCEYETVTLALLGDGRTVVASDIDGLAGQGVAVLKVREARRKKVRQYLISGTEILSGPHEWPGDRIPIVPVWGECYRVGSRKLRKSLISDAKDAMRMKNFAHSAYVERTAMAPKAPWLVTPKHIEGFEQDWRGLATGNPSVLPYNPDPVSGTIPQRVAPAPIEAAWVQEMALATDMIKSTTGIYSASLGQQSNETSGKAILARQREGDVGSYVFVDNCLSAVREVGRILVNMIPFVYDAPRTVRIIGPMDEQAVAQINQPGGPDLTFGKYDVSVQTGPAFSTRRVEAAESMIAFSQAVGPQGAMLIADMIAKNSDWPQADEVAERFKAMSQAMLPPQGPQPPDPAMVAAEQKMQADMAMKQMDLQAGQQKMQIEMAKAELEIQKIQMQIQMQREAHAVQRETQSAEMNARAAELGTQEMVAGVPAVQGMIEQVAASQSQMAQAVAMLAQAMTAPKRLVRGPDGKALGVETLN